MSDPVDRSEDRARVIDLETFKKVGARVEPDSPEQIKHDDEAMNLGNSGKARPAVHGPVRKGLVKPKRDKE